MSKGKKKAAKQPPRPASGIADVVLSVIPALFLVSLRTFAGPCVHEDGSAITCATAGRALTGLAIAAIVLCCMRILGADKATKRSFDLLIAIVGIVIAAMPGHMLQLCADTSMQCHTRMQPVARVAGILLVVGALFCEFAVDYREPTGRKRRRR